MPNRCISGGMTSLLIKGRKTNTTIRCLCALTMMTEMQDRVGVCKDGLTMSEVYGWISPTQH